MYRQIITRPGRGWQRGCRQNLVERPTRHGFVPSGPWHRRAWRACGPRRTDRVGRRGGCPARGSARPRARRLRGTLDHARPDRLPHPSRVRRRPIRRVRASPGGRKLCRHRPRGRRHRVDGARHAGRRRGGARRPCPAAPRCAARRGRHHHRGEVGLRPRYGRGTQDAAGREALGTRAPGLGFSDLSRRPRGSAGRRPQVISAHRLRGRHPARRRRGPGGRRRRLPRDHRVHGRGDRRRVRGGADAMACG